MANEIHADYSSSNVLYAAVRDSEGQVWYVASQVFETWGDNGHIADDYAIPLADSGGSRYVGDFDLNIPGGSYSIQIFHQIGANPADTDELVSSRRMLWTGSGELTATKLLANRAVQDKATGQIDYYDDDAQTVLLTHTIQDTQASIGRLRVAD